MSFESVVIVAAKRTPMGGFMGALSDAQSTELGATLQVHLLKRV